MTTILEVIKKAGIPDSHVLLFENTTIMRTIKDILLSNDLLAEPRLYTRQEILNFSCYLSFTSGSTGEQRAVMINQNTLICLLLHTGPALDSSLRKLIANSFSFGSWFVSSLMYPVYFGISTHIVGKNNRTLDSIYAAVE